MQTHDVWFTSDQHFWHNNVIEFCRRPFPTVEIMNQVMIENYRQNVKPQDIVYFLGDTFFCKKDRAREIMTQLPGRKILIKGNHDGFKDSQFVSMGFDYVFREAVIKVTGTRFRLSHYPYWPKDRARWEARDLRYPHLRPHDDGTWLLHGHVHCKWKRLGHQINVGVDKWGFTPVNLTQIVQLMKLGESVHGFEEKAKPGEESDKVDNS